MDILIVDTRILLLNRGRPLLLGGLLNSNSLGIYSIAYLIFNSVEQVPMKIMGDVSFPALSEVSRDRPTELKRSYYRFHVVIASFVYVCSGVLITSGASLVHLLYDPRYEQAGWMLEILCCRFADRSIPPRYPILSSPRIAAPSFNSNRYSTCHPLCRNTFRVLFIRDSRRIVGYRVKSLLIPANDHPIQCTT